jgi:hypothetical protein
MQLVVLTSSKKNGLEVSFEAVGYMMRPLHLLTDVTQTLRNVHAEQGAEGIFLASFDASCKKRPPQADSG